MKMGSVEKPNSRVWNAKFSEQSGKKNLISFFCSCINVLHDYELIFAGVEQVRNNC